MKKNLLKIFIFTFIFIPILFAVGFYIFMPEINLVFIFGILIGLKISIVFMIGIYIIIEIFDYG